MDYKIDLTEVNGLRNWYGKQPRLMRVACSQMLNHYARGTRESSIKQIDKTMTVRSPGFVSSRMRYTKASSTTPINQQVSHAGSVGAERFSGWTEQEKGVPQARKRFATLAGRGGSQAGKIRPSVRLKPGLEVVTIKDYKPRGGSLANFVAMLFRKKEKRLVRIKGKFYKLPAIKGEIAGPKQGRQGMMHRKLVQVQGIGARQPGMNHWMKDARAAYFRRTSLDKLWARTAGALMGRPGRR